MLIHLHKQATTTSKVRGAIDASDEPASVLAESFGTTEQTVYKWRHRSSVHDRRHTPHRLQAMPHRLQTTLNPAREAVAVALRKALLVSLDDLIALATGLEPMAPSMARSAISSIRMHHTRLWTAACVDRGASARFLRRAALLVQAVNGDYRPR